MRCGEAAQLLHFILFSGCVMPSKLLPANSARPNLLPTFFTQLQRYRLIAVVGLQDTFISVALLHHHTHCISSHIHLFFAYMRNRWQPQPSASAAACTTLPQPKQPPASRRMRLLLPSPAHLCSGTISPTFASLHLAAAAAAAAPESPSSDCFVVE